MNLSEQDVLHLAHLARIKLTDAEIKEFPAQLGEVIAFVRQINDFEVEDGVTRDLTNLNTMREDVITKDNNKNERSRVLANMPESESDYLKVPKIL